MTIFRLSIVLLMSVGCGEVIVSGGDESDTLARATESVNNTQDNEVTTIDSEKTVMLDDILKVIEKINKNSNNQSEVNDIIAWLENVAINVKEITTRDFTGISTNYKNSQLYALNNNMFSTSKTQKIQSDQTVTSLDESFFLVKGECDIVTAKNSIIFCTEGIELSHSSNNIIISNGKINISHDGSFGTGSIIYNKGSVIASHSDKTVFLFSNKIDSFIHDDVYCINTGYIDTAGEVCNKTISTKLKENYDLDDLVNYGSSLWDTSDCHTLSPVSASNVEEKDLDEIYVNLIGTCRENDQFEFFNLFTEYKKNYFEKVDVNVKNNFFTNTCKLFLETDTKLNGDTKQGRHSIEDELNRKSSCGYQLSYWKIYNQENEKVWRVKLVYENNKLKLNEH